MTRYRIAFALALLTLLLTFCLITLGGIVHNTGSSLACPDWPLCYGQLMPEMTGGVLYEHSHRLLGALVGLCAIGLVIFCWRAVPGFRSIRPLAIVLLAIIIFQGILGGLTVIFKLPTAISTAHLAVSMIVLLLIVRLAHGAWLRGWRAAPDLSPTPYEPAAAAPVRRTLHITLALVYIQIVLGAFVRHSGAWAAAGQGAAASLLPKDSRTGATVFWPSDGWGQFNTFHRYFAFIVAALVIFACYQAFRRLARSSTVHRGILFWLPAALVLFQILLGIGMIAMFFATPMRTAHLAVAAALLALLYHIFILITHSSRAHRAG